jgi:hypothetical protein
MKRPRASAYAEHAGLGPSYNRRSLLPSGDTWMMMPVVRTDAVAKVSAKVPGRPRTPSHLADRIVVDRVASLAKNAMKIMRQPDREIYGSERELKRWLDDAGVQYSTSEITVTLTLLEGLGFIHRAAVKPNASRAGWLTSAAEKAAKRVFSVNGITATTALVSAFEDVFLLMTGALARSG